MNLRELVNKAGEHTEDVWHRDPVEITLLHSIFFIPSTKKGQFFFIATFMQHAEIKGNWT